MQHNAKHAARRREPPHAPRGPWLVLATGSHLGTPTSSKGLPLPNPLSPSA
jgi:hypothetical protein